jgi:hypothetical protein
MVLDVNETECSMDALDVLATDTLASRSSGAAQRLVVSWRHPENRLIQPVGFLSYDGDVYRFTYIRNALRIRGFQPLLGFRDLQREYRSAELFPLFAQRAMDPRRPDFRRYVERLGLEGEPGPWEQISRSQGRRQGDTLQLLPEPALAGDALTCLFLVHGIRHAHEEPRILDGEMVSVTRDQVNTVLEELRPGDELALARETGNGINPLALMVTAAAVPIGWMPDLLVDDVQRLMRQAEVSVTVEHVNGPEAPWHMRVLARLYAAPASGFRFFTGEQWTSLAVAEQAELA